MQHPRTAVNSLSWGIRLLGGRASNIVWEFWIPKMQMSSFKPSNISWIYDHLSLYVYIYIHVITYCIISCTETSLQLKLILLFLVSATITWWELVWICSKMPPMVSYIQRSITLFRPFQSRTLSPLPPTTHKDVAYWLAPHLLKVNLDC